MSSGLAFGALTPGMAGRPNATIPASCGMNNGGLFKFACIRRVSSSLHKMPLSTRASVALRDKLSEIPLKNAEEISTVSAADCATSRLPKNALSCCAVERDSGAAGTASADLYM